MNCETLQLLVPDLEGLAQTLHDRLLLNFETVSVTVVDCPDLTQKPFDLAAKGIGGSERVADVGGVGNLFPVPKMEKNFKMSDVCSKCDLPKSFVIGPGAGPLHLLGQNSEMVHNCSFLEARPNYKSRVIYLSPAEKDGRMVKKLNDEKASEFSLMANLLLTEGKPGKVLKIEVKKRKGTEDFVNCLRLACAAKYGTSPVAMGGVFVLKSGKALIHIMPELPDQPFSCPKDIDDWLKYFEMSAPLVCTSVFISHDPGLDLRVEHSHCYSNHNDGGHYHHDVSSADEVEYEAYYTPAKVLYRLGKP